MQKYYLVRFVYTVIKTGKQSDATGLTDENPFVYIDNFKNEYKNKANVTLISYMEVSKEYLEYQEMIINKKGSDI